MTSRSRLRCKQKSGRGYYQKSALVFTVKMTSKVPTEISNNWWKCKYFKKGYMTIINLESNSCPWIWHSRASMVSHGTSSKATKASQNCQKRGMLKQDNYLESSFSFRVQRSTWQPCPSKRMAMVRYRHGKLNSSLQFTVCAVYFMRRKNTHTFAR